jgi:uncharacterized protein YjbI with pentapeptide repeats
MMEDRLDEIRRAALDHAAKSGSLEDIEKAASVAKSLAEAQKSATDAHNAYRQLRLQWITSLASFLVPIVSLLALFATIYVQSQQLSETRQQNNAQLDATRQQNEDTQWRDLLTSLRGSAESFDSDVTVSSRLRSFFHSARYGDQARDISVRLMGRLTNSAGFKDLYDIVFAEITPDVFANIVNVGRSLNSTRLNIEAECSNLSFQYKLSSNYGLCTVTVSVSELTKTINSAFPERAFQLRQALTGVYAEMVIVSKNMEPYLKTNFPINASANNANSKSLDLSSMMFFNIDLSGVNFANMDLQRTIYWNVNFDKANLRNVKYNGIFFNASNWWDAANIDQTLLDFLITYQYPFWNGDVEFAPLEKPTLEHYTARIAELCQPLRPACKAENLKFGLPAKGT